MIRYTRHILNNGLTLVVHEDENTPLAALCVQYKVGSKNENPAKTGLAHLFEHLMFTGSKGVKDLDTLIQRGGGDNNAYTNADTTVYHSVVPVANLKAILWAEADRMAHLSLEEDKIVIQKNVVVEEFKETCLNEPYGDMWHHMSSMAYKVHPYRWPTIGIDISHIESIAREDVFSFYQTFYRPANAVISIVSPLKTKQVIRMAEEIFGGISSGNISYHILPEEPKQTEKRYLEIKSKVPSNTLYLGYHMGGRLEQDYYVADVVSDILAEGRSARLFRKLVKTKGVFSETDAFISGTNDPGLFMIECKLSKNITFEKAVEAVQNELKTLQNELISADETQKMVNKSENGMLFSQVSPINKAVNLAYYESIGQPELINNEFELYQEVTPEQIRSYSRTLFDDSNCCELRYIKK